MMGSELDKRLDENKYGLLEAVKNARDWMSKFVMRFYIASETPTYEKMKRLYQELGDFQRELGADVLAKIEGKDE